MKRHGKRNVIIAEIHTIPEMIDCIANNKYMYLYPVMKFPHGTEFCNSDSSYFMITNDYIEISLSERNRLRIAKDAYLNLLRQVMENPKQQSYTVSV